MALSRLVLLHLLAIFAFTSGAWAKKPNELRFSSKIDSFKLTRKGNKYFLGSEPVPAKSFENIFEFFEVELDIACESLPKRPDLTIRAKVGGKTVKRKFYFAKKIVSDGRACVDVTGKGIFFLPTHRSYFKEDTVVRIKTGKRLVLFQDGREILNIVKENDEWRNTSPQFFTDWNFFEDFLRKIKKFKIDRRIATEIIKRSELYTRQNFSVRTGGKEYRFYRVGENMWALKLQKTPWLISADAWSFFETMDQSRWRDSNFEALSKIMNKSLDGDERLAAIDGLGRQWSRSIKHTLQNLLSDSEESPRVKLKAVGRLRTHPSDDNFMQMVKALRSNSDPAVLNAITKALKIRNPTGRVVTEGMDPAAQKEVVEEWTTWSKSL